MEKVLTFWQRWDCRIEAFMKQHGWISKQKYDALNDILRGDIVIRPSRMVYLHLEGADQPKMLLPGDQMIFTFPKDVIGADITIVPVKADG
jgi:hypothetical protein